jgi:hypothetical protein
MLYIRLLRIQTPWRVYIKPSGPLPIEHNTTKNTLTKSYVNVYDLPLYEGQS